MEGDLAICYMRMTDQFDIAARLKALRNRAGFSMDALSRELGMKGASSYQRYEHPKNYARKHYLPLELAIKVGQVFEGNGDPPVEYSEVMELAGVDRVLGDGEKANGSQQFSEETQEVVRLYDQLNNPVDRQSVLNLLRSLVKNTTNR